MGRKTWFSIPYNTRPLENRINMVLTNDKSLLKRSPLPAKLSNHTVETSKVYFVTLKQFVNFHRKTNANVFVIGGCEVYKMFLNADENTEGIRPEKLYITEVSDFKMPQGMEPNAFMPHPSQQYKLIGVSEKHFENNVNYRFLTYKYTSGHTTDEIKYLELCSQILEKGNTRSDRTGVGSISSFGHQIRFDISTCVPLLTTKRVPWRHCIEELLWFMRGDTDANILKRKGVKIWDGNTSREFLDSRGLYNYDEGILGAGYGWQWRFFGAKYSQAFANTSTIDASKLGGFDQLQYVIDELKNNPFSRRIMMSYWNPPDFDKTALVPCHFSCQFYVEEDPSGQKHLSCHFTMRSNDLFLGHPFNIFSYSVLTHIIALKCNMKPKSLVYTGGDVHIYANHVEQMKEQLTRNPRPLPIIIVNPAIEHKEIQDITINDFEIVGYFPDSPIKAPMAI
jgi:thymidylate synthase